MNDRIGPGDLDIWRNPFVERARRQPGLRWWQVLLLGLMTILLLLAGAGAYLLRHIEREWQNPGVELQPRPEDPLDPFNVLLVGSDSREGLTEEEMFTYGADYVPGERADTLIIAQVDPEANTVTMVQFPRDLFVPVVGRGPSKINSALEDGAANLVATMENLTGLGFHHYAEVNIAGFRDIIDAIDGVDLCITDPIPFDPMTGIEVPEEELGLVHFDGERALRFVRSRAFPSGDLARIQNQQAFVSAAVDKVLSTSTFFNPGRLRALYSAAGDNLEVDARTTLRDLLDLADRLKSFDPSRYEAYIVPNLGPSIQDGASVVLPDEPAMELMFDALDRNMSPQEADGVPDISPSTVHFSVFNAGFAGGPEDAAAQLKAATSFEGTEMTLVETGESDERHTYTFVRYAPGAEEMARFVAAALPHSVIEEDEELRPGIDVAVYPGRFFQTQRITQIKALDIPPPEELPAECR